MAAEEPVAEKGDEILSLLEVFSSRLNAVEKEIQEGTGAAAAAESGRNRRRRNMDDRGQPGLEDNWPSVKVKEELRSLQDELHSLRRSARTKPKPKGRLGTGIKLVAAIALFVLAYLYWNKLSKPALWQIARMHRDVDPLPGGVVGREGSFLDRVHGQLQQSGGGSDALQTSKRSKGDSVEIVRDGSQASTDKIWNDGGGENAKANSGGGGSEGVA